MEQETNIDQVKPRWFIDLNWFQQNNRSFPVLVQNYLCPKCCERLREQKVSATDLFATITDCCSKTPDFITGRLPILESVFRLFLASGNQALDLEELGGQLREWRGDDAYRISADVLSRLLSSDQYYGLRQIQT